MNWMNLCPNDSIFKPSSHSLQDSYFPTVPESKGSVGRLAIEIMIGEQTWEGINLWSSANQGHVSRVVVQTNDGQFASPSNRNSFHRCVHQCSAQLARQTMQKRVVLQTKGSLGCPLKNYSANYVTWNSKMEVLFPTLEIPESKHSLDVWVPSVGNV